MKKAKSIAFLAAVAVVTGMASCKSEVATEGPSRATIDSLVNARVDSFKAALTAENDSLINARAYVIADSILNAAKAANGGKVPAVLPKPKPAPKPTPGTGGVKPAPTPTPEPTKPDPGSTTTRPGAKDNSTPKSTTDRAGAKSNSEPKSTSDRPGSKQN